MKKSDAMILRQSVSKLHDLFRETATNLPGMPDIDISVRENHILSLICRLTEEKKGRHRTERTRGCNETCTGNCF